jgi:peptide/nickel transport system permease protein
MGPAPVGRRVARFAGLVCVVVVLNFFVPRALPGSPLAGGDGADTALLPAASRQVLLATYYLDAPLSTQFAHYLRALLHGDMGWSIVSYRPVSRIVAERLPWTLFLVGGAVVTAALLGGLLGWASARRRHGGAAGLAFAAAIGIGALPEFLVSMILIVFLASREHLFPAAGAATPFARDGGLLRLLTDILWHAALPGLVLVIALLPAFALLVRNAVIPVLGERYLVTARAKGLPPRRIAWHALRNALPPVVTLLGLRLAAAVAGAAVVERIFAYPGMGLLVYEAVGARDYPVLQGVVFISSLAVLTMNFLLDAIAARLDPRTAAAS